LIKHGFMSFLTLSSALLMSTAHADKIEEIGDFLTVALPLSALGGTYAADDREGRWMFLKGYASSTVIVWGTKKVYGKWRPNCTLDSCSEQSFPSGHAVSAFGGASFIQTRYGYKYGVPAYAAAVYTAYSRVEPQKHYLDDVMAGGSIAMLTNWAFTDPLENGVSVAPMVVEDGVGVAVNMKYGGDERKSVPPTSIDEFNYMPDSRFEFEFGVGWSRDNYIKVDGMTGDEFNFNDLSGGANNTPSVQSGFDLFFKDGNEVLLRLAPLELRDFGQVEGGFQFGDQNFADGETVRVTYLMNEFRARWRKEIAAGDNYTLKAGAGLSFTQTRIAVESQDVTGSEDSIKELNLLPVLHLNATAYFTSKFSAFAEIDGMELSSNDYFYDFALKAQYKINKHWDYGLGYRHRSLVVDDSALYNKYREDNIVMHFGYAFSY